MSRTRSLRWHLAGRLDAWPRFALDCLNLVWRVGELQQRQTRQTPLKSGSAASTAGPAQHRIGAVNVIRRKVDLEVLNGSMLRFFCSS